MRSLSAGRERVTEIFWVIFGHINIPVMETKSRAQIVSESVLINRTTLVIHRPSHERTEGELLPVVLNPRPPLLTNPACAAATRPGEITCSREGSRAQWKRWEINWVLEERGECWGGWWRSKPDRFLGQCLASCPIPLQNQHLRGFLRSIALWPASRHLKHFPSISWRKRALLCLACSSRGRECAKCCLLH